MKVKDFTDFIDKIREYGLEYFKRYYGWYPGEVCSNIDPEDQGRIKVKVAMLQIRDGEDELTEFAYPLFGPFVPGADKGTYAVPDVGDKIWVSFRNGNSSNPMYAPWGWFGSGEKPAEFETVEDRGWKTAGGHVVRFRDAEGGEAILIRHKNGNELEFTFDDKIRLVTKTNDVLEMDAAGDTTITHRSQAKATLSDASIVLETATGTKIDLAKVTALVESLNSVTLKSARAILDAPSVELGGSGAPHPVPQGDLLVAYLTSLLIWLAAHTHPPNLPPATLPPTPLTPFLSSITRTK